MKVEAVEISEVDPVGTVKEAMEEQTSAERKRRAAILDHKFRKTQHQIIIAKSHFHPAHSKPFYPVHTSYIKEYIIKVKEHGFKRRACRF